MVDSVTFKTEKDSVTLTRDDLPAIERALADHPENGEAVTLEANGERVTITAAQWAELVRDPGHVFRRRDARPANEDGRRYTFVADLTGMKLGTRKVTEGDGPDKTTYTVPELTVTLKVCDEHEYEGIRALLTNQRLSPFFNDTVTLTIEGEGTNLSLF